jgi:phage portal protein BeeE
MLIGLPGDNADANDREANRALWRLAILPLAGKILDGLGQGLAGWFAEPALRVDVDRATALAKDSERLWRQVAGADFLSDEEKRGLLGLD